jgi:hypothetical protein
MTNSFHAFRVRGASLLAALVLLAGPGLGGCATSSDLISHAAVPVSIIVTDPATVGGGDDSDVRIDMESAVSSNGWYVELEYVNAYALSVAPSKAYVPGNSKKVIFNVTAATVANKTTVTIKARARRTNVVKETTLEVTP